MRKSPKERIAFEALMIMLALAAFCLITRLWPLVFLVVPGILIAAIRLLALSAKGAPEGQAQQAAQQAARRPDTEPDVIRIAFGILQRRVAEQVMSRYPSARWVWEAPDAIGRFADGLPLTILLNHAGGHRKAVVQTHNLQFRALAYVTTGQAEPDEPPTELDADGDTGLEDGQEPAGEVDYALIAFQWAESSLLSLNSRCNDAIAEGRKSLLISDDELPPGDSWAAVCEELTRNGFAEAAIREDGIAVSLPA
jgi:hypothetical protein